MKKEILHTKLIFRPINLRIANASYIVFDRLAKEQLYKYNSVEKRTEIFNDQTIWKPLEGVVPGVILLKN